MFKYQYANPRFSASLFVAGFHTENSPPAVKSVTMKILSALALLLLLAGACQQNNADRYQSFEKGEMAMDDYQGMEPPRTAEAPAPPPPEEGEGQPGGRGDIPATVSPKIIRNADVSLSVDDYAKGRSALARLVEQMQATIAHEAERRSSYRIENNLTIRLAPEKLDSFVIGLEKLALHVESKNISSRDVTREFVDLETRLSAKRATVDRYREILRSAKTVQEILAVEQQLRALIEEIESVEGQLRYMRDQVQFSTVNLTLYQEFDRPDLARPSFWKRIGRGFSAGWHTFLDIVVGLVSIWPVTLLVLAGIWWGIRRLRRRRG
jgi:hypothetical protein